MVIKNVFFRPSDVELKFSEYVSFYRIGKILCFLQEARFNCNITLKTKCVVIYHGNDNSQKQPSRGVLRKRCCENMQQIYKRSPMLKYDGWYVMCSAWVFSCEFAAYF